MIGSSTPGKERLRARKRVTMSLTHIFCYHYGSDSSLPQRSVSKESVACNTAENRGEGRGADARGSGLHAGQMRVCSRTLRLPSGVAWSWRLHFVNVRFLPYTTGVAVLTRGVRGAQ